MSRDIETGHWSACRWHLVTEKALNRSDIHMKRTLFTHNEINVKGLTARFAFTHLPMYCMCVCVLYCVMYVCCVCFVCVHIHVCNQVYIIYIYINFVYM